MRIFLLCFASIAFANFTISPFVLELQVSKGETTGWFEVANPSPKPTAVELIVFERILNLDGKIEDSIPPSKDFVVYPSELLLRPNARAKVQVTYSGTARVESDKAYILQAKEIPLPVPQEDPADRFSLGFSTIVAYQPTIALKTGKPGSLTFVSSQALDSGKVEVIVENKSHGRVPLDQLYLLIDNKKITDFTGKSNSIMPGQKRRFVFKHDKPLKASEIRFGTDGIRNN